MSHDSAGLKNQQVTVIWIHVKINAAAFMAGALSFNAKFYVLLDIVSQKLNLYLFSTFQNTTSVNVEM